MSLTPGLVYMKCRVFINSFVICLLILAAFALRLWGLPPHPSPESNFYLSYFRFFYYSPFLALPSPSSGLNLLSPQLFMFMAALAGWAIAAIQYSALGLAHIYYYQPFSSVMFLTSEGEVLLVRFCSIIMGTFLVYLVYRIGIIFWSRREGWISALLIAFLPGLVNNSRYIGNNTAAAFFISGSLLFSATIIKQGNLKWYLLAGLSAGLAGGVQFAGGSIVLVLIYAHFIRKQQCRDDDKNRRRHGYLICALLSFLLGVMISYPAVWYNPTIYFAQFSNNIHTQIQLFPENLIEKFRVLLSGIGIGEGIRYRPGFLILPLALGGAIVGMLKKNKYDFFLILSALIYFIPAILFNAPVLSLNLIPIFLIVSLLAARFLIFLIYLFRLKPLVGNSVTVIIIFLIIFPSILTDLKTVYLSRLKDPTQLARDWIENNLPPGSRINPPSFASKLSSSEKLYLQGGDYLVLTGKSMKSVFPPFLSKINVISELREFAFIKPQKVFRTKTVDFINSPVTIYNLNRWGKDWEWKTLILRDLDFDYSQHSPEILILEDDLGYEGKSGFWMGPYADLRKLIVSPRPLEQIGVEIHFTDAPTRVKAEVGGRERDMTFEFTDPVLWLFDGETSFPYMRYFYRLRLKNFEKAPIFVKIITSPRQIARRSYRLGLSEVLDNRFLPNGELALLQRQFLQEGGEFDKFFKYVFSENADWWREKYKQVYTKNESSSSSARTDPALLEEKSNNSGILGRIVADNIHLPAAPWVARFQLQRAGAETEEPSGELLVCQASERKKEVIARQQLSGKELYPGDRYYYAELSFANNRLSNRLEFRVNLTGLTCRRVEIYPDLQRWFNEYLKEEISLPVNR